MKNSEAKKLIPVKVQFEYVTMAYAKDGQSAEAEVRSNLSQVQEDMSSFGCFSIVTPLDAVDKQTFKRHYVNWDECIPWGEEDSRTCSKILEDIEEENLKANLTKEQIDKILNQLSAEEVKFMLSQK